MPPIEKTFEILRDGTIVIPFDWSKRYDRLYSVYFMGDPARPLFDSHVDEESGRIIISDPWIAVTPLRHARLIKRWDSLRVNYDEATLIVNGQKYLILDGNISHLLYEIDKLVKEGKVITFDILEQHFERKIIQAAKRFRRSIPDMRSIFAWVVCVLIGLRFLDIEYNL